MTNRNISDEKDSRKTTIREMISLVREFVIEEWRSEHRISWVLILFSSLIVVLVSFAIEFGLSRSSIYPDKSERFDIDHIYMAAMGEHCPGEALIANKRAFEACITKLSPEKMTRVSIPIFDEIGDTPPSFMTVLKQQPNSEYLAGLLKEGHHYIIGIEIPAELYQVDENPVKMVEGELKVPVAVADHNVLTFRGMRFGRVCVDGDCSFEATAKLANFNFFPLRTSEKGPMKIVWVFAVETSSPAGIQLDEGILVANSRELLATQMFYGFYKYGPSIRGAMWFVALFLVTFVFAISHRRYSDYPTVAYLAASFALWLSLLHAGILFPLLRMENYQAVKFYIWSNLVIATVLTNLAFIRKAPPSLTRVFFLSQSGVLTVSMVLWLSLSMTIWQRIWPYFSVLCAIAFVQVSGSLLLSHIRFLEARQNSLHLTPRISQRLDFSRRIVELRTYLGLWVIFFVVFTTFTYRGFSSGNITEFTSYSIVLFTGLLGVMLYFTHSKQRTRVAAEPIAELERLRERMPSREFAAFIDASRQDILFVPDLARSSDKDAREKSELMYVLLNQIHLDLAAAGYFIDLLDSGGDDWKIILSRRHNDISVDLRSIIELCLAKRDGYLELVHGYFSDCSLHMSLYVLPDNYIRIDENARRLNLRSELVFSSRAANLFLKFASKPLVPGALLVGGPRAFLGDLAKNHAVGAVNGREIVQIEQVIQDSVKNGKLNGPSHYMELAKILDLGLAHIEFDDSRPLKKPG